MAQITIQQAFDLALQHHQAGHLRKAEQLYREILALEPKHAGALHFLGVMAHQDGRHDVGIDFIRKAIAIKPEWPEAFNNLGLALKSNGQIDQAIAAWRQAIALRPHYPNAILSLGLAHFLIGQLDEAIACYRQAIALRPDYVEAHSSLVYALHFHPGYDARAIHEEALRWDRRHAGPLACLIRPHGNDREALRPLRVGYVSPDFRDHVVGHNLLPLLGGHDRKQFNVTCYSNVLRPDAMTRQIQAHTDCWRNIVGVSDEKVAEQIREDKIDILIDLTLHMAGNRLLVFARKPAPVQMTYLAYCGSSGMSAIDYRFSDVYMDPPECDLAFYSEKTVELPESYWCYQPKPSPEASSPPVLKNGFVTFGCLNNFAKVSSAAVEIWIKILVAQPDSRLIIHGPSGAHREAFLDGMERAGVARGRVNFIGMQSLADYFQTYCEMDIALDPFPYAGGITTLDALWMGVPVVTLSGQTAVGRGGRSILSNLGLQELIAATPQEYVRFALELARNVEKMSVLRAGMRARMLASPLMDAEGFARNVEAAYRRMWRGWCERAT